MSDTSDYTIVDDSSSSSSNLSSGQAQVQVQDSVPIPVPSPRSPGSYKIMGHAANEIGEMLQLIRNSIIALYEALVDHFLDDGWPQEEAKCLAASNVDHLVDVLKFLGKTVALLPEEGHVETAELLVYILDEASSMLVADGEGESFKKLSAQCEVLTHKCLAQAQLRASHSRHPAQAEVLRRPVVNTAIHLALASLSFENRDAARSVANVHHALLPTYVRSLTSIYGFASGASSGYVEYAKSVVAELDRGNDGAESKTSWYTWYRMLGGWQVRAWCSSFWR
ncbi:hypothetical protein SBRCBS47491_002149 [Sporothrix bragantina]|uniref:Uncharacterized protein n=1 Tax=Sporothrix bragantina TaxID=671064 RepID=A0ABP0B4P9_9PEZI